jgi:hypothetical protein
MRQLENGNGRPVEWLATDAVRGAAVPPLGQRLDPDARLENLDGTCGSGPLVTSAFAGTSR